jgi:plasmid stabilization system protein ParE
LSNLESILNYLESNWTEREVSRFKAQLNRNLEIISRFPAIFPESKSKSGLRRAVLNKQVSIIYQILEESVLIAYLVDNRQDISELI